MVSGGDNLFTRAPQGGIKERAGTVVGRAKAISGWNLILRILMWIITILFVVAIIAFVYFALSGGLAGSLATEAETGLEETGAGRTAVGFFKDIFEVIVNPEKAVARAGTFETTVRDNKDKEELGVFLDDLTFNAKSKAFEEGRKIVGRASLKSESLLDTATVRVGCDIKGYTATKPNIILSGSGVTSAFTAISGTASLFDGINKDYKEIIVFKGRPSINSVLCEYKEGILLSDIKEAFFESADRTLAALKFSIIAAYDFKTEAFSRAYYMDNKALESILLQGEDPFKKFSIKDPLIQKDGIVKSENTAGPISLFIASPDAQPFTEENTYFLEIGLKSAGVKWKGDLRQLNKLEVHIPNEILIDEENCDLERANEDYNDEAGLFEVYNLKQEHIERINKVCSETAEEGAGVFGSTCLDRLEDEPNFLCQFTMQDASNVEPEFTYLRGKAFYVFETSIADTINILKREVV